MAIREAVKALFERAPSAAELFQQGMYGAAVKAIPFNGYGGGDLTWAGSYAWNPYANSAVNYKREAGDLGGSSLVMAAVNWMGTNLPEAPLQVLKQKSAKVMEPVLDHPMSDLLQHPTRYLTKDGNPREWYSSELLWKAFAFSWIIDGNVYIRKVRNASGQVIQLWYEPHFTCRPRWPQDGSEFISHYEVLRNGLWYRVEVEDIIHSRYGIDPNTPQLGLSPVASVYREIFTDGERARYSALILKNGGVIPFIISPDPAAANASLSAREIKDEWEYRTTGDNLGRPMVLTGPIKVQDIGVSPEKLLVEKASAIPEERLAAVIGIPAAVLGYGVGLDQTKVGATMRELREQAYESFLIPTQRVIAGELKAQLLPEFGDTKGLDVKHDLAQVRVLQEDRKALFERETMAFEKDIKTRAEVRSALGLDTKPEDEIYFSQWRETLKPAPEMPPLNVAAQPQLVNGKDQSKVVH